jgi:hypothetical protein
MANEPLERLVYLSTSVLTPTREDLRSLAAHAAARNAREGISGILCYRGGSFLQVLEGPSEKLEGLWQRLLEDGRHTFLQLLVREPIETPLFDRWSMGLCDLECIDGPSYPEFIAIADFLANCPGLDGNTVVLGILRHFRQHSRSTQARGA